MTAKKATAAAAVEEANDEIDMALLTEAPEDWEFETVVEESPTVIIFEVEDVFVGLYKGTDRIEQPPDPKTGEDMSFTRYLFEGRDRKPYATNESFKLKEAMAGIDPGTWVRITCTKEIPTKRGQSPMKDFKVEARTK